MIMARLLLIEYNANALHPASLHRTPALPPSSGGTVVHMSSGYAALVAAWYLGPRTAGGSGSKANVPHVLLGTAMLWFGWFGFNSGSACAASALAGQAFLTTTIAPASAMVTWMLMDYLMGKQVGGW